MIWMHNYNIWTKAPIWTSILFSKFVVTWTHAIKLENCLLNFLLYVLEILPYSLDVFFVFVFVPYNVCKWFKKKLFSITCILWCSSSSWAFDDIWLNDACMLFISHINLLMILIIISIMIWNFIPIYFHFYTSLVETCISSYMPTKFFQNYTNCIPYKHVVWSKHWFMFTYNH